MENEPIRKIRDLYFFRLILYQHCITMRNISYDVKIAAICLHERQLVDLSNILECCGLSRCMWFCILKLWCETGNVVSESASLCGHLHCFDSFDIHYLHLL